MPSVAIRGLMFCNKGQAVNQTKSVWRPFHKPKWWDVFKQTQHNTLTATDLFKGNANINGHYDHVVFHASECPPHLCLTVSPWFVFLFVKFEGQGGKQILYFLPFCTCLNTAC